MGELVIEAEQIVARDLLGVVDRGVPYPVARGAVRHPPGDPPDPPAP